MAYPLSKATKQWMNEDRIAAFIVALAAVAICVGAFYAWHWFEGYRASIWAAEMRKAGVAAPAEVR